MPHKIEITISDDWASIATHAAPLTDEQTLMALERAAHFYRNRLAVLMFHKVTNDMMREQEIRRLAGGNNRL